MYLYNSKYQKRLPCFFSIEKLLLFGFQNNGGQTPLEERLISKYCDLFIKNILFTKEFMFL